MEAWVLGSSYCLAWLALVARLSSHAAVWLATNRPLAGGTWWLECTPLHFKHCRLGCKLVA